MTARVVHRRDAESAEEYFYDPIRRRRLDHDTLPFRECHFSFSDPVKVLIPERAEDFDLTVSPVKSKKTLLLSDLSVSAVIRCLSFPFCDENNHQRRES